MTDAERLRLSEANCKLLTALLNDASAASEVLAKRVSELEAELTVAWEDDGVELQLAKAKRRVAELESKVAEVLTELRRLSGDASNRNAYDDISHGKEVAYDRVIDLIEEKLTGVG